MGTIILKNQPPTFIKKVYFGRPNPVDKKSLFKKYSQILKNKWLTNDGPFVQEFERTISEYLNVKHCVAVTNATVGLEILEKSLNLSGEVIVPSMTFIASPNSLLWQGIKPIFCDVDKNTWNLDPSKIEKLITPKTTAIMGVHVFGRPCSVDELKKIADAHNLHLIYDAAHAFGCSRHGVMVGNFGDAEVFSFHATKFFNSIEGGAIVTNDSELFEKLKMIRNFGFSGHDKTEYLGINGKMNEFSAAFGLTSFEQIDTIIKTNETNYYLYQKYLSNIPGIKLIEFDPQEKNNYQYIMMEVDKNITKISRDQLVKILWSENVIVRRYFYPGCHKLKPYFSSEVNLPITDYLTGRLIALPTGIETSKNQIRIISRLIKYCVTNGSKLSKLFRSDIIEELTGNQETIIPEHSQK